MAADALAPSVARSSAATALTMQDQQVLVVHESNFNHLHHLSVEKL